MSWPSPGLVARVPALALMVLGARLCSGHAPAGVAPSPQLDSPSDRRAAPSSAPPTDPWALPPAAADAPSDDVPGEPEESLALLAVDEASVYIAANGSLTSYAKNGERRPLVLASGEGEVLGIAVDATHVYWTREDKLAVGLVRRAPKGGAAAPETMATLSNVYSEIAVDAHAVYLVRYLCPPGPHDFEPGGRMLLCDLIAAPKSGGAPVTLLTRDQIEDLSVDATYAYVVTGDHQLRSPRLTDADEVDRVPKAGGAAQKAIGAVAGLTDVASLVLAEGVFFWQDTASSNIMRLDRGATVPVVAAEGRLSLRLAADARSLCWIEYPTLAERRYTLACMPSGGGDIRVVARPATDIYLILAKRRPTIVVDGGRVYWPRKGQVWWASTTASVPEANRLAR